MLPVQEIVISPDEGVIGTGLQFTFPKGMGQNQLGGIKAVVGVVERADVAIAFGLAFFLSLLVIITFAVYQVGVEVYVELLYAALIVGIQLVPVGLLQVLGGMYGVIGQLFICPDGICRMVTAVIIGGTMKLIGGTEAVLGVEVVTGACFSSGK